VASVRIVFPTAWDKKQLAARPSLLDRYDVEWVAPDDADCPQDYDVLGCIDESVARWREERIDGVFSSSDYPGAAAAAAIARGLGLPGTPPGAIMRAAHKGVSRRLQAACMPEVTPAFCELDPEGFDVAAFPLPWPCFVKPAKGCFSVLARRVDAPNELTAFLTGDDVRRYRHEFLRVYRSLAQRYLEPSVDAGAFVAETLVRGRMATVEGYALDGEARPLGVVDSVQDARTGSFVAFEYPSTLPAAVQRRIAELSCRLAAALGLRFTLFNVEWMWEEDSGRLHLIEINPRMCGQFADLYEKVDGVHGYRIALDVACGRTPERSERAGTHACAASFPLRVFEPVVVRRTPAAADLAAAADLFPGTLVWNEVETDARLDDFVTGEDGHSCRYAVVNVGAGDRAELRTRLAAVEASLGYRFETLAPAGHPRV